MRELLRTLDSRELAEWLAYYRIEPWGEERADLRAGYTSAILANVYRKAGAATATPEDFIYGRQRQREQTTAEQQQLFRQLGAFLSKRPANR